MKRKMMFFLLIIFIIHLYAQDLRYENLIVKKNTDTYHRDTFYLGQVKSKNSFNDLFSNFKHEKYEDYYGFKNVIKVYDDNIDLYFIETDVFTLIEIKLKSEVYELYNTSLKVGNNKEDFISNYSESIKYDDKENNNYYVELEDITSEFEGSTFYNILVSVKDEFITSITLYYSFAL